MHKSYKDKIAPVVTQKWQKEREAMGEISERTEEPKAGFRAQVAREVFTQLPVVDQKACGECAKQEAATAKAEYLQVLKDPPSKTPEARHR
jgi:hypothetical protein